MLIKDIPENLLPVVNNLIGNLRNFYTALQLKGYYLPRYESNYYNFKAYFQVNV